MLRKTLAVAGLVAALGLGLAATAPAAVSRDGGDSRITAVAHRDNLGSWLQELLSRLLAVWAMEGGSESGVGTPLH